MVDFISNLPIEVAEDIIGYLDGEDISSSCQVCQQWQYRIDQEHIWHRMCQRRGWVMNSSRSSGTVSWRNIYWLHYNWTTGRYRRYTINGDDLHPAQHRSFQLDGKFLIVPRANSIYKSTGINIWDISGEPYIHQVIYNDLGPKGKQFKAYRNYIVQQIGSFIRIHYRPTNSTKYQHFKLLHFKENVSFAEGIFQVVSDVDEVEHVERFTPPIFEDELNLEIEIDCNILAIHKAKKFVYLWNLEPWKRLCSVNLDGESVSYIRIIPNRLFCVMNGTSLFRVYDFEENTWTMELNGNSRHMFNDLSPVLLNLYLSPTIISSYYKSSFESTFKVWDRNGDLVRVIDLPGNLHFQCAFIEDGILLTPNQQTILMLSSGLDELQALTLESPCEAMDAGPGQTLILVYQKYYEVWDWKTGTKRYTISLPMSLMRQINTYFCAQEIHNYNHSIKINILNFTSNLIMPLT